MLFRSRQELGEEIAADTADAEPPAGDKFFQMEEEYPFEPGAAVTADLAGADHGAATGVKARRSFLSPEGDVRIYRSKRQRDGEDEIDDESFNDSMDDDVRPYIPRKAAKQHEIFKEEKKKSKILSFVSAKLVSVLAMLKVKGSLAYEKFDDEGKKLSREEDIGPEVSAQAASKYYGSHIKTLRLRLRFSLALTFILVWISAGLPVAGALKTDLAVASIVCLILLIAVVMLGLDVFTIGLASAIRGRPSLWSLVSFTCIITMLDAAVTAATAKPGDGMPFCAIAAVSMTCALWASQLTCRATKHSTRALTLSKDPYTVTAEQGISGDSKSIIKSRIDTDGYVRNCESPDVTEDLYTNLSIVFAGLAFLLAIITTAVMKEWRQFFHVLSAIMAAATPVAALLAFPLPYSQTARKLFRTGSALAGWEGVREIGRSRHMIVTDSDIFPPNAISMESVRILDGVWPEKVITAAGSIICASGSGASAIFIELMKKNDCSPQEVEDFYCHEGGGLTARINGEEVICGSSGFMQLMSIRLPQRLASESAVYVAINGTLSGIFTLKYSPLTSVQSALSAILTVRRQPVFAVRDFLVTPMMIGNSYKIPTDGFDFPTFAKRYDISAVEPGEDSRPSAIISREGLGAFVSLSERARRLYTITVISVIVAIASAFIGMGLMSYLLISGIYATATVGNLTAYLLIWTLPLLLMSYGLLR